MTPRIAVALVSIGILGAVPAAAHGVFSNETQPKAAAVPFQFRPTSKSVEVKVDKPNQAVFVLAINQADGHISDEAPFKITLDGKGLNLTKASFTRKEAAEGDVHEAKLLTFKVPIVAHRAGTYTVKAKVDFSMCTAKTCMPKHQTAALHVVAKGS